MFRFKIFLQEILLDHLFGQTWLSGAHADMLRFRTKSNFASRPNKLGRVAQPYVTG